jgi:hypothetical protein
MRTQPLPLPLTDYQARRTRDISTHPWRSGISITVVATLLVALFDLFLLSAGFATWCAVVLSCAVLVTSATYAFHLLRPGGEPAARTRAALAQYDAAVLRSQPWAPAPLLQATDSHLP